MGLPCCKWDSNHTGQDTLCTLWGYRAKVFLPGGRGKSFGAEHPMGDTQMCCTERFGASQTSKNLSEALQTQILRDISYTPLSRHRF